MPDCTADGSIHRVILSSLLSIYTSIYLSKNGFYYILTPLVLYNVPVERRYYAYKPFCHHWHLALAASSDPSTRPVVAIIMARESVPYVGRGVPSEAVGTASMTKLTIYCCRASATIVSTPDVTPFWKTYDVSWPWIPGDTLKFTRLKLRRSRYKIKSCRSTYRSTPGCSRPLPDSLCCIRSCCPGW